MDEQLRVGLVGEPFRMPVELGKVREMAAATGTPGPFEEGVDAPASPIFLTTQRLWQGEAANVWRRAGLHNRLMLHAEQEFTFHGQPPRAGDVLVAQARISDIRTKTSRSGRAMTFVEMRTDFTDEDGRLVAESKMTGVEIKDAIE